MAEFWVRVPASTSNLGPGFDVLGLALDLFLEARFVSNGEAFSLVRDGTLADLQGPPEDDLMVQALRDTLSSNTPGPNVFGGGADRPLPPGVLTVTSQIPVGRGLGSSAAAVVAGRILGLLASGQPVVRHEVVEWGTAREGHPDNVAPAVLGGLVAGMSRVDGVTAIPLPLSPSLAWVFAAPGRSLSTKASRGVLPDVVPREAAVRNAARLALLIPALAAADGRTLRTAMADELHVPYRLPLIPGAREAVDSAVAAGAWAATLSGAGSGLIAVAPAGQAETVGEAMAAAFRETPGANGGFHLVLSPWLPGAEWGSGQPTPREHERRAKSQA